MVALRGAAIAAAVGLGILGIAGLVSISKLVEDIPADENVVIQSPVKGQLDWYTTPGLAWQGFGEVTAYKKRAIFQFEPGASSDRAGNASGGIVVRFNDGGHGTIYGSIQYELPSDPARLTALHSSYRTQQAVHHDLIVTVVNKSIYLVGTLMSSKESYAEKRNDLIHYVMDQVQNGIYRTRQVTEWITDSVTNERKQVTKGEIILDKDGRPERQEDSILNNFGIRAYNFSISSMPYDKQVEDQIKQQQQIAMDMQTSAAQAKMADQRALTSESQGKANATEAKWRQETEKVIAVTKAIQEKEVAETNAAREKSVQVTAAQRDKEVAETLATQRLSVARLDKQSAEQKKAELILLGEGEATRKKALIEADGALEPKLATYERVMPKIFEALRGANMVPSIILGGTGGSAGGANATDFINLLTAKTAKDLALDLSLPAKR